MAVNKRLTTGQHTDKIYGWLSSKWDVYHIPSLKGPGIITDEEAERLWEPNSGLSQSNNVFWTQQNSWIYWLTTAVTAYTRSSWWDVQKGPLLSSYQPFDDFWERQSQFSSGRGYSCHRRWLWTHIYWQH